MGNFFIVRGDSIKFMTNRMYKYLRECGICALKQKKWVFYKTGNKVEIITFQQLQDIVLEEIEQQANIFNEGLFREQIMNEYYRRSPFKKNYFAIRHTLVEANPTVSLLNYLKNKHRI